MFCSQGKVEVNRITHKPGQNITDNRDTIIRTNNNQGNHNNQVFQDNSHLRDPLQGHLGHHKGDLQDLSKGNSRYVSCSWYQYEYESHSIAMHCSLCMVLLCTFGKLVFAIIGFAVIDYFYRTLAVTKNTEDDHLFTDFVIHAVVLVPSLLLYIFTFFYLINVSLVICSAHDVALGGFHNQEPLWL